MNYNFFGHKNGILPQQKIPNYESLKDNNSLVKWHIFMSTILKMESISKSKNFTSKTIKSPRQLIFGRDMISNVQILQSGSVSMQVNNFDPGKITRTQKGFNYNFFGQKHKMPLNGSQCNIWDALQWISQKTNEKCPL